MRGPCKGRVGALTDCRLPVFGRASENQGLRWGTGHRPCLRLGRGLASTGATEKRRGAVKGRAAAKRSDVYPLRRPLFCRLDAGSVRRERPRAQAPTRALAGRPSTDRANRSLDRAPLKRSEAAQTSGARPPGTGGQQRARCLPGWAQPCREAGSARGGGTPGPAQPAAS